MTVKGIAIEDASTNASSYLYHPHSDGAWQSVDVANGVTPAAEAVAKPPPQTTNERWHGLSTPAKIGIAVGVVGALIMAIVAFFLFFIKQRRAGRKICAAEEEQWAMENAELMRYKTGMDHDEYDHNSVSVAAMRKW